MASLKVKYNASVVSDLSCWQYWIYTKYWREFYRSTGMCPCRGVWATGKHKGVSHRPEFIHFYFMLPDSTESTERRLLKEERAELWQEPGWIKGNLIPQIQGREHWRELTHGHITWLHTYSAILLVCMRKLLKWSYKDAFSKCAEQT